MPARTSARAFRAAPARDVQPVRDRACRALPPSPGTSATSGGDDQIEPVERLDIELWTDDGELHRRDRPRPEPPARHATRSASRATTRAARPSRAGAYELRLVAVPGRRAAGPLGVRSIHDRIDSPAASDGRSAAWPLRSRERTFARTPTSSRSSSSPSVRADASGSTDNLVNVLSGVQEGGLGLGPDADGRRHRRGLRRATASSTTSRAGPPRAASATTPTSPSTRSRRSPCG